MTLDARSLERLRQLGRTLPQRLPPPEPAPTPEATAEGGGGRRHRLETETDPEALFRELMQASADGTAPPHLLERLRELEARRARAVPEARSAAPQPAGPVDAPTRSQRSSGRQPARGRPDPTLLREHGELYSAFQQLLLEDDEI